MEASGGTQRMIVMPRRFQGRVSTVRAGTLTVDQADSFRGDDFTPGPDFWGVRYEARIAAVHATIALGPLAQGVHDLPFGFVGDPALRDLAITIRLKEPPAPPTAPAAPEVPPTPEHPLPEPAVIGVAGVRQSSRPARITSALARSAVRSALRRRLRGWRLGRVGCVAAGDRRVTCAYRARRGGSTLTGRATVTLRAGDGALRYRISTSSCRPAASRGCRGRRS